MIGLSESVDGIRIHSSQLDQNGWLFNCKNGTLDLQTGLLRQHKRDDLITKEVRMVFDPEAKCPTWLRFLSQIFGNHWELIEFVHRLLGYCLTGSTREQQLSFLLGGGARGKSTLLEAFGYVMGDYQRTCPPSTLLAKNIGSGANSDVARLQGARFVKATETEADQKLAAALIKQLTGGDTIAARPLYHEYSEYRPTFKIFLATNHPPRVRGSDDAMWRRIHVIPFDISIPKKQRDSGLLEKLKAEGPGILAWAVEGCLKWQRDGLKPPPEVLQANARYRTKMDTVGPFLEARCTHQDPGSKVRTSALYSAYGALCAEEGWDPVDRSAFRANIEGRGFEVKKTRGYYYFTGLALEEDRAIEGGN